jgi:hypothetical protein
VLFGSVKAPPIKAQQRRNIMRIILEDLQDNPLEKPSLCCYWMEAFVLDEFDLLIPNFFSDSLKSKG